MRRGATKSKAAPTTETSAPASPAPAAAAQKKPIEKPAEKPANTSLTKVPTVEPGAVHAIVAAEPGDPFAVLGPHQVAP